MNEKLCNEESSLVLFIRHTPFISLIITLHVLTLGNDL